MANIQKTYRVWSNKKICPRFYHLKIQADGPLKKVQPGQFVHIRVQPALEPFFRRPFCVYQVDGTVDVLYEAVGKGTALLSEKKKGDPLDILGPLGNRFSMPPRGVKQVVLIAGGIGVAPFLFLSDKLKKKGYEMILLYGGRTREYVFPFTSFKRNGCQVHIATDDGSVGMKGRVAVLFPKIARQQAKTWIYTCGPRPMMAAVQQFAREHGIPGEASCEETMACGLGACLGCATKTSAGYKTVCYDGPVFDLEELIF